MEEKMFGIDKKNTRHPLIKICGIMHREDAQMAADLGAHAVGCICTKNSKRYVRPHAIAEIFCQLPSEVTRVAVVVNPSISLLQQLTTCHVDCIQFHGDEDVSICSQCPLPWYKAVQGHQAYIQAHTHYQQSPTILVDSPSGAGKGIAWQWQDLVQARKDVTKHTNRIPKPIILAGGLTPQNVSAAIAAIQPYAVDTASAVEMQASQNNVPQYIRRKDPQRMQAFIDRALCV